MGGGAALPSGSAWPLLAACVCARTVASGQACVPRLGLGLGLGLGVRVRVRVRVRVTVRVRVRVRVRVTVRAQHEVGRVEDRW